MSETRCESLEVASKQAQLALSMFARTRGPPGAPPISEAPSPVPRAALRPEARPPQVRSISASLHASSVFDSPFVPQRCHRFFFLLFVSLRQRRASPQESAPSAFADSGRQLAALLGERSILSTMNEVDLNDLIHIHQQALMTTQSTLTICLVAAAILLLTCVAFGRRAVGGARAVDAGAAVKREQI